MQDKLNKIKYLYEKQIIKNKLESIYIGEFRNFAPNSSINFQYPLSVFVGKNGVGKSTILNLIKTMASNSNVSSYIFDTEFDTEDIDKDYIFSYKLLDKEYINIKNKDIGWVLSNKYIDPKESKEIREYKKNVNIIKPSLSIKQIEFKSIIGAFDKNIFFDNIGKTIDREAKIDYAKKQIKKINQGPMEKSKRKIVKKLSNEETNAVNYILGKNYKEITMIYHKFFNGTWGSTCIFDDGDKEYSEINSGSGEFIISNVVLNINRISKESILLIDEPEISIHPGGQKRFIEFILDMIIKKKLQVIISTHSPSIIDKLPPESLKKFYQNEDGKFSIVENISYNEAFVELEFNISKKIIIVEDDLAKSILRHMLEEEGYSKMIDVEYYPGGAESIKTLLITAFSKANIYDRYILFDGDKYIKDVIDMNSVIEQDKTLDFYENELKGITGVNSATIKWGIDASRSNNIVEKNKEQKKHLIEKYLKYYRTNVSFFPKNIPEEIIFDEEYTKLIFPYIDIEEIKKIENYKEKILKVSKITGIEMKSLFDIYISNFVKNKKESYEYKYIKNIIQKIIGE